MELLAPAVLILLGFPCGSAGKESACNAGDLGLIPGLGRSPEEGKGYPLQYSGLENSTDCIVHGVAKSWTRLSDFHLHTSYPSPGEGNGNSLQCSCLENPMDGGAWGAEVHGLQRVGHNWATNTHTASPVPLVLDRLSSRKMPYLSEGIHPPCQ